MVIPARYASVRFPGKPLALIAGKPMVQHVYEKCSAASGIHAVTVATEDERIAAACQRFGGPVEITSSHHRSGTDRVAEVAARHPEYEIVLNVQGDEPAMESDTVSAVAAAFKDREVEIASAITPLIEAPEVLSPHVVKAVLDRRGDALYFSRAPIPFDRGGSPDSAPAYWRHLGIYGFRRATLLELTALPPSDLERAESLEQLRWLQAGYRIRCMQVNSRSRGVDTPADLAAVLSGHLV